MLPMPKPTTIRGRMTPNPALARGGDCHYKAG
jgi:hypothetical protein